MMRNTLPIVLSVLYFFFFSVSCERPAEPVSGDVHIYLLESYETSDQSHAIDPASAVIRAEPLIPYSEIYSYDPADHTFRISGTARDSLENRTVPVDFEAFGVVAGGEVIYTGYFWPSLSSAICQWVVIDPLMISGENKLEVRLGYPGPIEGVEIPDHRNHPTILAIFRSDGKLEE